jgi:hypothetical protein
MQLIHEKEVFWSPLKQTEKKGSHSQLHTSHASCRIRVSITPFGRGRRRNVAGERQRRRESMLLLLLLLSVETKTKK